MSNERLEELAAESASAQSRRAQLTSEIAALQKSLDTCRRRMPRAEARGLFTPDATTSTRGGLFGSVADSPAAQSNGRPEKSPPTPKPNFAGSTAKTLHQNRSPPVSKSPLQAAKLEEPSVFQSFSKDAKDSPAASGFGFGLGSSDKKAEQGSDEKHNIFAKLAGPGIFATPSEGSLFGARTSNGKASLGNAGGFGSLKEGAPSGFGEKQTTFAKSSGSGIFGRPGAGLFAGTSPSNKKTPPKSGGPSEGMNL